MSLSRAACLALTVSVSVCSDVAGQAVGTPAPAFEVASVRRNESGETNIRLGPQPGGRFRALNVTARQLIQYAYRLQDFQLVGGPSWTGEERFDLMAQGPADVKPEQMPLLVQQLLRDRFQLQIHTETREAPSRALVFSSEGKRLGPSLRPSSGDCKTQKTCGFTTGGTETRREIRGIGEPFSTIPEALTIMTNTTVVDQTGLTGEYDFELKWSVALSTLAPRDDEPPVLATALREQLGLRLEDSRAPIQVVVIDQIGRPTPN